MNYTFIFMSFITVSTCSYGTNSDSSEEYVKSCLKGKPDARKASSPQNALKWDYKTTPESRSNISTKVLKVSNFSKNLIGIREFETKSLEIDNNFDNKKNRSAKSRYSQSKTNPSYAFPKNKIHSEFLQKLPKSSEISRVVDVVPPRNAPILFDYHVPDQTIGIPVKSLNRLNYQNELQSSNHSNSFDFFKSLCNVQEGPSVLKRNSNDTKSELQIIHHPLISGNIPANFNFVHENKKKILNEATSKSTPHGSVNVTSVNRCVASQQTSSTKREVGERNKVKFSNTVTIAVVPVRINSMQSS